MPKEKDLEIACSLSDTEMKSRRSLARQNLVPHIQKLTKREAGLEIYFLNTNSIHLALREFVKLERQCCGFLTFKINRSNEQLQLDIDGPLEARDTIKMFADGLEN